MRTLYLIVLYGLIYNVCFAQTGKEITEKQNVYNKKGDFYLFNEEFEKAIVYYNLAYQKDIDDYFWVRFENIDLLKS